ncbi:hypothetical protein MBLNU230_g5756t2 [Neophaeotheca triangularis]
MPIGRIPQSSYYDKNNRPSAALYRARQPYLVKNAVTGLCIIGFVAGVCTLENVAYRGQGQDTKSSADTWTLKAVGQDDFSDIPMPDVPAQPAQAPHASGNVKSAGSTQ